MTREEELDMLLARKRAASDAYWEVSKLAPLQLNGQTRASYVEAKFREYLRTKEDYDNLLNNRGTK